MLSIPWASAFAVVADCPDKTFAVEVAAVEVAAAEIAVVAVA